MRGCLIFQPKVVGMSRNRAIEERVLRVLYEGPVSATDCALELQRYVGEDAGTQIEIERALVELAARACATVHVTRGGVRYSLAPAGSERLARLVEEPLARGSVT